MSVHDELNNAKAEAEVWRTIACWSDVELAEELAMPGRGSLLHGPRLHLP